MKPKDMTDEQLRIRVAKLLGCTVELMMYDWRNQIANWPQDLNACHEMEEYGCRTDIHFAEKWLCAIALVLSNGETDDYAHVGKWNIAHATARQRCEAFVEVMSK